MEAIIEAERNLAQKPPEAQPERPKMITGVFKKDKEELKEKYGAKEIAISGSYVKEKYTERTLPEYILR